jgi:hypothetical protein
MPGMHPVDKDRWVVRRSAMRVAEGCLGVAEGGYDPFFEPHLVERLLATVIEQEIVRHLRQGISHIVF